MSNNTTVDNTINIDVGKTHIDMGVSSILGTREYQQDSLYAQRLNDGALGIVCDGMGGLSGGELASKTALKTMLSLFSAQKDMTTTIPDFLYRAAVEMDKAVVRLTDKQGNLLNAGTTAVAAIIQDGRLYWMSVGDSKLYLIRDNCLMTINREHNYRLQLDAQLEKGEITKAHYNNEIARGEALISYIGMGNVQLIDVNQQAIQLKNGDKVLLCSDGLYKCISEQMILETMKQCGNRIEYGVSMLMDLVKKSTKRHKDNTSVVLMAYYS